MILKAIPYLEEALIALCLALALGISIQTVRLSICKANLRVCNAERIGYMEQLDRVGQQVLTLRAEIDTQNEIVHQNELLGAESQAAMDKVAEYTRRLAQAEQELSRQMAEHHELREMTENLSTCETYEMVLRSIAGGLP